MVDGAILLGCSTGGASALATVLGQLDTAQPGFVVPHLPDAMAAALAAELPRGRLAREGEIVVANTLYILPNQMALTLTRFGSDLRIGLQSDCREPIDATLATLTAAFGAAVRAVILSGMDRDGARGVAAALACGGKAFAQADAAVMSMPNAAIAAGATAVPLSELPRAMAA